jgi:hypothetical protein
MPNTTTDNLLAAFADFSATPEVKFEYRVYYNPTTKVCLFNTIEKPEGTFIVVTREQYDAIEFCPNYIITKSGKLERKKVEFNEQKVLQLSNTGYRTLKDHNMFIVDDNYKGETDSWTTKDE